MRDMRQRAMWSSLLRLLYCSVALLRAFPLEWTVSLQLLNTDRLQQKYCCPTVATFGNGDQMQILRAICY